MPANGRAPLTLVSCSVGFIGFGAQPLAGRKPRRDDVEVLEDQIDVSQSEADMYDKPAGPAELPLHLPLTRDVTLPHGSI
jgi:hypothetical protein